MKKSAEYLLFIRLAVAFRNTVYFNKVNLKKKDFCLRESHENIYSDHGLSAEFIGFPNWNGI